VSYQKRFFWLILILLLAFSLRFFKISTNPHDLYIDEVSIGLNAATIVADGRDEYGQYFPVYFKAFGEYKLPIYIYTVALWQKISGPTPFSVRAPSAFFGSLTVLFFYLLIKETGAKQKIALIASFLLAVSSWHLHFSRAGFEATLGLFLLVTGLWLFFKFINSSFSAFLFSSLILFGLALYTYFPYRLFLPFLIPLVIYYQRQRLKEVLSRKKKTVYLLIIFMIIIPFLSGLFFQSGLKRARDVSLFNSVPTDYDDYFTETLLAPLTFYLKNFSSYFSLDFLFFIGDGNGRHSLREAGQNSVFLLPLAVLGLVRSLKKRKLSDKLFLSLFIIPAAVSASLLPSPHALRSLPMVLPIIYFSAKSLSVINSKKRAIFLIICSFFIYTFIQYLHIYYVHYRKKTSPDWSGGYRQTVEFVAENIKRYKKVYVTKEMGFGETFFRFYLPQSYLGRGRSLPPNIKFISSPFNPKTEEPFLYIGPHWEKWDGRKIGQIRNSGNDLIFNLWEN